MRTFGLIGCPLEHSFSKKYFVEKFEKEKIEDAVYKNFSIENIDLFPEILKSEDNICGFNVTSPYKLEVIPFLNELDDTAKKIGAVNCIKVQNNKLIGYNTDVYGFVKSLEKYLTKDIKTALILGTGGAAKAVSYGLQSLNISFKFVSSSYDKLNNSTIHYSNLNSEIIESHKLIINATPLGIFPDINNKPNIPYNYLTPAHILYDLIYNPSETLFLKEGKKKEAIIINGFEMLKLQAEKAWEIFNS